MRIALDTNRYVDLFRGDPQALAIIENAQEVIVPFVTLAELRAGFLGGTQRAKNEARLADFLSRPRISIAYPTDQTTHIYADLTHHLRRQGTPIPTNDVWIAAITLEHGLTLYARDAHFDHLPQLTRI